MTAKFWSDTSYAFAMDALDAAQVLGVVGDPVTLTVSFTAYPDEATFDVVEAHGGEWRS